MSKNNTIDLSEDFLTSLFLSCTKSDYMIAVVVEQLHPKYFPDKGYSHAYEKLEEHYRKYGKAIDLSAFKQSVTGNPRAKEIFEGTSEHTPIGNIDHLLSQLEIYIRQVKFKELYKELGPLYNDGKTPAAIKKLQKFAEWERSFSLLSAEFENVLGRFSIRFKENRSRFNEERKNTPITRFYIDGLDQMNAGRDLRTQLSCFLASTGVGKSHAARWIGKSACQLGGLNVLHIQLEGSKEEVVNAYSASFIRCSTYLYETGTIKDNEFEEMQKTLEDIKGTLFVKAYPKFNAKVSTTDIKKSIQEFRKKIQPKLDVVVIDSIDLLEDASGKFRTDQGERHKRIAVANDLKDIAADENIWVVGTYQSTIENREWINDEKNVLTEFNTAEAKGLARPLTHLITLNQSERERKERTMRLYVAKSRFFEKGDPIRIATDYDHEQFYDHERTLNLNKVS